MQIHSKCKIPKCKLVEEKFLKFYSKIYISKIFSFFRQLDQKLAENFDRFSKLNLFLSETEIDQF